MQKITVLSLSAAILFGASSFANAQWGWYGNCRTCANGQCSLLETAVPVEPCKPVETCSPCKPVEPCQPVEEKILEVPEYLPLNGEKIPIEPCTPAQVQSCEKVAGTCEQQAGVVARRERECRLLTAVNRARARFGLAPCQMLPRLEARAKNISLANARWNSLFHSGYGTEIIATNSWGSEDYLVQQWLKSPGHRRLLLGNYRYIGVATAYNGSSVFGACQFSNCGETSDASQQTCSKNCALNGNCRTCTQTRSCSYSRTCSRTYVRRGLFGWRRCCY